ncbi:MAG: GIY-YIG nuclease family protein [Desulfobacteria bacterium]
MPKKDDGKLTPYDIATREPPFETKELRKSLRSFLNTPHRDPDHPNIRRIGGYKYGVYAFYDYDGEPIYVGQTRELLSGRIGRHLTNQRTDAVAMNVLDPYEVYTVEIWPLPQFEGTKDNKAAAEYLDRLEYAVYQILLSNSKFEAVLNEKAPPPARQLSLPKSYRASVVTNDVREMRGHPDTRIARRASTLARLAQVISERDVQPGLRRTLVTQARRLQTLAEERYKHFEREAEAADAKPDGED